MLKLNYIRSLHYISIQCVYSIYTQYTLDYFLDQCIPENVKLDFF